MAKITTKELAKKLLIYLGHNDQETKDYDGISIKLMKTDGVTKLLIEEAITALCANGYAVEAGKSNGFGQRLTAKGRRMARQLRGE